MAKILVTGGAGYIGSILVPRLLEAGHEVIVIDNFRYRQNTLLDYCHHEDLSIVRGSCYDWSLVAKEINDVDYILPLACIVGAPACDMDRKMAYNTNFVGVMNVLNLRDKDKQKIIYPTTNSGYGIGQDGIYCTEETPLNPVSYYGKLKVEAEKKILEEGNAITLRLATVFGMSPRMRLDLLVNDFVYRAVNDRFIVLFESHFKRNYIHIRDVAKAFIHSINNFDAMKNQAYNVGLSDTNISKRELCQEIKKQVPDFYFTEAEIGEDADKRDYMVSNEKIENTAWRPDWSLQDGITELIKGYKIVQRTNFSNL